MTASAIIPAGGTGKRFAAEVPKQFVKLGDAPMIIHTLRRFQECDAIDHIVLASHALWIEQISGLVEEYGISKVTDIVPGGDERHNSVYNALISGTIITSDYVLVHDAVRPFVTCELIRRIIEAASEHGAAIPALAPIETLKEVENGSVKKTLRRSDFVSVQTPQGFSRQVIMQAYENIPTDTSAITDDASLVELAGFAVKVIEGEETNLKITRPRDIELAEIILSGL